jgi:hypothetical protein
LHDTALVRGVALLAGWAILLSGCYYWIPIKPTEAPKLTAGARYVERTNGNLYEFVSSADVRVTTARQRITFSEPRARIANGLLVIESASHPPATFVFDEVAAVEASQLDKADTAVALLIGLFGLSLAIAVGSYMRFPGP